MRISKLHSVAGKAINVRRVNLRGSVTTYISIAQVISIDDDDVGLRDRAGGGGGEHTGKNCEECDDQGSSDRSVIHTGIRSHCVPLAKQFGKSGFGGADIVLETA